MCSIVDLFLILAPLLRNVQKIVNIYLHKFLVRAPPALKNGNHIFMYGRGGGPFCYFFSMWGPFFYVFFFMLPFHHVGPFCYLFSFSMCGVFFVLMGSRFGLATHLQKFLLAPMPIAGIGLNRQ